MADALQIAAGLLALYQVSQSDGGSTPSAPKASGNQAAADYALTQAMMDDWGCVLASTAGGAAVGGAVGTAWPVVGNAIGAGVGAGVGVIYGAVVCFD